MPVQIGQAAADVHHQHDAGQRLTAGHVVTGQCLPGSLGFGAGRGKAIARRVHQEAQGLRLLDGAHGKQVQGLRAARRAAGEGQSLLVAQGVDAGRLAGIGATNKGHLRQSMGVGPVELGQLCHRVGEAGGRQDAHAAIIP